MKCPLCGRANPENAAFCKHCESEPAADPENPRDDQRTKSPTAIAAFVLAVLSFVFFIFAAIPAVILALFAISDIKRSPWQHTGRPLARRAIRLSIISTILITAALAAIWTIDAPPIPNDYTIADLRSAPPDCDETFELLKNLTADTNLDPGADLGLSKEDIETIQTITDLLTDANQSDISSVLAENRRFIELAWSKSENARRTITQLAKFEEIADLSDPSLDSWFVIARSFVPLGRLYLNHTHLRLRQGDIAGAIDPLLEFDAVARKLTINARMAITKVICLAAFQQNMRAANAVANSPRASRDSIIRLAHHFTPLTDEHLSMRNSALFTYLSFKTALSTRPLDAVKHGPPLLKGNSTLRLHRNYCDRFLTGFPPNVPDLRSQLGVWPQICSFLGPVSIDPDTGALPLLYRLYNPAGAQIFHMVRPGFSRGFTERFTNLLVLDDLLQIILAKRLGRPFSLKARAYGDNYIFDLENKKIFSPGPDLAPNTKDDISLPIDPEVLGFDR